MSHRRWYINIDPHIPYILNRSLKKRDRKNKLEIAINYFAYIQVQPLVSLRLFEDILIRLNFCYNHINLTISFEFKTSFTYIILSMPTASQDLRFYVHIQKTRDFHFWYQTLNKGTVTNYSFSMEESQLPTETLSNQNVELHVGHNP